MKIELTDKEIEGIGRSRWSESHSGGKKWGGWMLVALVLWVIIAFLTRQLPYALWAVILLVSTIPFIYVYIRYGRIMSRQGREFLLKVKREGDGNG